MIRLIAGDCRTVLATLPAESVHCVVTSPPYYALRDYGTAQWDGGDAGCGHAQKRNMGATTLRLDGREHLGAYDGEKATQIGTPFRGTCGKCGATRIDAQIGLEASPDEYLATMVQVFREIRRVLRRDGTCWVNMGDSYASSTTNNGGYSAKSTLAGFTNPATKGRIANDSATPHRIDSGAKPKDLLLMPARLALALQQDGWWVRSAIVWAKPNPMPESCTDRPTSAYEMVYLLTRSAKYFYDADAVREEPTGRTDPISSFGSPPDRQDNGRSFELDAARGRNLRNVWTIATHPYSQAHFATFPAALAERCIRAGTSERGCCAQCGAPWVRVVERGAVTANGGKSTSYYTKTLDARAGQVKEFLAHESITTGWALSCTHAGDPVPCVVLDPFCGAGTTLLCSDRLQRDAIGIELNPAYTEMAMARCRADAPLFADLGPMPEPPEEQRQRDMWRDLAAD